MGQQQDLQHRLRPVIDLGHRPESRFWAFGTNTATSAKFNRTAWSYTSDSYLPYYVRDVCSVDSKNMWAGRRRRRHLALNGSSWTKGRLGHDWRPAGIFGTGGQEHLGPSGEDGVIPALQRRFPGPSSRPAARWNTA